MNERFTNILWALALSVVTAVLIILAYNLGGKADALTGRILVMMGAGSLWGIIQFITYFAFYWGLFEIIAQMRRLRREEQSLYKGLLPEDEHYVLAPFQVAELKLNIIRKEQPQKSLLGDLIIKACTKFRANKSSSEALDVVSAQCRINQIQAESIQSVIRYCLYAIPSIGFIGTVIGIAQSLTLATDTSSEGIKKITSALNVAFDTTLVALVLSLALTLYFHVLQERTERLHTRLEAYIIENLINRIYKE